MTDIHEADKLLLERQTTQELETRKLHLEAIGVALGTSETVLAVVVEGLIAKREAIRDIAYGYEFDHSEKRAGIVGKVKELGGLFLIGSNVSDSSQLREDIGAWTLGLLFDNTEGHFFSYLSGRLAYLTDSLVGAKANTYLAHKGINNQIIAKQ
jgi:hypothetical protein